MTGRPPPAASGFPAVAVTLLRVGYSSMVLAFHGWHKVPEAINHFRSNEPWKLVEEIDAMGVPMATFHATVATAIQVISPILLALGLWTWACSLLLTAVLMGAAAQNISADRDPQLAILYMLVAFYFFGFGPGPWSLDARRQRTTP